MDPSPRSPEPGATTGTAAREAALDAQAAAFARLLGLSNDMDSAFRAAVALADGLFPHQVEGVAFLLGRRRAILADDMGLGKTRQAIVSLRHALARRPVPRGVPGVGEAQLGARDRGWSRPTAPCSSSKAATPCRHASRRMDRSSTTTSSARHARGAGRVPWAGIVFDEAHYLKNHTSARSRVARQLVDRDDARAAPGRASRPCIC